jgi:hypothetical protein
VTRAKTNVKSVLRLMEVGGSFQNKAGEDDGLSAGGVKRGLSHGGPELLRNFEIVCQPLNVSGFGFRV